VTNERPPETSASTSEAAIWHDVECGAYAADFKVWDELADRCGDPILELGAGTGRLAIHLARRGHRVIGLDYDEALIAAQAERAAGLPVTPLLADARDFDLPEPVALVLAPMQLLQMLPDRIARLACLEFIRSGTTRFWDMYWHPEATARAVADAGIRATIGAPMFDKGRDPKEAQAEAEESLATLSVIGDPITAALAPHSIYMVSEESLRQAAARWLAPHRRVLITGTPVTE